MSSTFIAAGVAGSRWPIASTYAILPPRTTISTAPGTLPCPISERSQSLIEPKRCDDSPTCSGVAFGSPWAAQATERQVASRRAANGAKNDRALPMNSILSSMLPPQVQVGEVRHRGDRSRVARRILAPARVPGPGYDVSLACTVGKPVISNVAEAMPMPASSRRASTSRLIASFILRTP